jgi:serine protease AprX
LDEGKVAAWADFLEHRATPYDDSGHGTHVAGIAAGSGDADPGRPGAAPHARLAVGKVLDAEGRGTSEAAARGIDWCIAQGAGVINLSLEESDCNGDASLADAVRRAREHDVLLVATAGNHGERACSIHAPGRLADAFTVGALAGNDLDAPEVASFSGRGDAPTVKPDLVAPGLGVRAAAAGTTRGLRSMDGTSMAAPYVAGVASLLRAAHPEANAALVAEALRESARDGGPPGPDPAWGWGAVDPAAALAWLDARALPAAPAR